MSERTPVQEVFADVDPDPDAIFEAAGADTPAELIAGGGRHDPVGNDADETGVTDLLGNLKDAAVEPTEASDDRGGADDRRRTDDREPDDDRCTPAISSGDSATVPGTAPEESSTEMEITSGEPSVTVVPGDGAVIDDLLGIDPTPDSPTADLELVGRPTVTRVASDAFGGS
ncbi:hypothetical protein [Halosolutus halophilus]|uniref:hypothetical protein n=1 Tax=Halosolutus halophilus TaxID=1552990 RepID=UPI002234F20B|nr:hypothetical protein [Halosolutus halophilus]